MSNEANAAIVRRYVEEVLNQQNIAALDSLLTPGFTHGNDRRGISGQAAALRSRFSAFPDAQVTIEHLLSDDDQVAIRATWRGAHRQEWLGIAASNAKVTWGIMVFFRIENGKIAQLWAIEDAAALLRQLREAKFRPEANTTPTPAAV
ncbi:MAG: ester cyclase [Thermomicrobiales bacterium]